MPLRDDGLPYFAVLVPAAFALFWVFISLLISMLSGWHALAEEFRQQSEPCGQTRTAGPFFYAVYMRYWCHYSSVIRVTAADDALHLSVLGLFRVGHPPLCIPWKEIQIVQTKWRLHSFVLLTLGGRKSIPLRISERMAAKLGILDRISRPEPQTQLRSWSAPASGTTPTTVRPPPPLQ